MIRYAGSPIVAELPHWDRLAHGCFGNRKRARYKPNILDIMLVMPIINFKQF